MEEEGSSHDSIVRKVRGMESVVATVSGYHGSERFNLIKLISHAGASFVGKMSRSITHLICWKFEGSKYDIARKCNTIVVNHKWIEDSIKQGKRIPERPYMLESGEEVGPLLMQVPVDAKEGTKKRRILSDRSNFCNDSTRSGFSGVKDFEEDLWTDSLLLEKKTKPMRSSRVVLGENRDAFTHEELDVGPSRRSLRKKKNLNNASGGSAPAEPSRRGRRLVKNNSDGRTSKCRPPDPDDDCYLIELETPSNSAASASPHLNVARNGRKSESRIKLNTGCYDHHEQANDGLEDVEEIRPWNGQSAPRDSYVNDSSNVLCTTAKDDSPHAENIAEVAVNVDLTDSGTKLTSSIELSCVICWTEFSSTRGILPCGHRFCYSCIRNWADHMASNKKTSTCPLCKTNFLSITKVDDAACSYQKIYSQTIPDAQSSKNIYILPDQGAPGSRSESSTGPICIQCHSSEPQDLLISCHLCQIRHVHNYCLDPLLLPWTCIHCKDLQMVYYRTY